MGVGGGGRKEQNGRMTWIFYVLLRLHLQMLLLGIINNESKTIKGAPTTFPDSTPLRPTELPILAK